MHVDTLRTDDPPHERSHMNAARRPNPCSSVWMISSSAQAVVNEKTDDEVTHQQLLAEMAEQEEKADALGRSLIAKESELGKLERRLEVCGFIVAAEERRTLHQQQQQKKKTNPVTAPAPSCRPRTVRNRRLPADRIGQSCHDVSSCNDWRMYLAMLPVTRCFGGHCKGS